MLKFLGSRKRLAIAIALLLCVLVLPFLWSRFRSGANQIQVIRNSGEVVSAGGATVTVACYNIAHGRGLAESNWDGGDSATRLKRLDEIADLLKQLDAEVVVLNEVDFDTSWSNHVNQAEYLAEKAGYPFRVEERNLDFRVLHRTWRFGNAVLSKYPISHAKAIDLPSYASIETALAGKKRGVQCDVEIGGTKYRILGVHLSHRSEDVRNASAQKISEIVNSSQLPCIVMGDMNSSPPGLPGSRVTEFGENAIETLDGCQKLHRKSFPIEPDPSNMTFRSDQPKSIIDWVFVADSLVIESYEAIDSKLSDHRPIVAVLNPIDSAK